jgi:ankyrin repeat protein
LWQRANVNADVNVTVTAAQLELVEWIQERDWHQARQHLTNHPENAQVWLERRGPEGGIVLRQLILHQALMFFENGTGTTGTGEAEAEETQQARTQQQDFIEALLRVYPEACAEPDNLGRTPLHCAAYAAQAPPVAMVETLIQCFPNATQLQDKYGKLPLHAAVSFPLTSLANAQAIYQEHPQAVWKKDQDGAYPVHLLAWGGNAPDALPILKLLLEHAPMTLFATDDDEETPLAIMAKYGRASPEAIRYVLEQTPQDDVWNFRDDEGNTLLHHAVRNNPNIFNEVLKVYFQATQIHNRLGLLPLHAAVWKGCQHASIVEDLLGVYPEAASIPDRSGYCPLHYACQEGVDDIHIVHVLLQRAPKIVQQTVRDGSLPLHLALRRATVADANVNIVTSDVASRILEEYPLAARVRDPQTDLLPLHMAILTGQPVATLVTLIHSHPEALTVPIQPPEHTGIRANSTAWHLLAIIGPRLYIAQQQLTIWNEFLQHPAGISQEDTAGRLVLHHAVGPSAILLLEAYPDGAKVQDEDFRLPLLNACRAKDTYSVTALLQLYPQGANIYSKDGSSALHEACSSTQRAQDDEINPMILQVLEAFSQATSKADREANLPLHLLCASIASHHVDRNTLEQVVRAFPDALQAKNDAGHLPLHQAIQATLASESIGEAPYLVDGVTYLLDQYPTGAKALDGFGKAPLAKVLQAMDCTSALRLDESDSILGVARTLYEIAPQVAMNQDGRGRTAMHYCAVLMGNLGGGLKEGWASFIGRMIDDYPTGLATVDEEDRTPLHLLLLYLGETAIEARGKDQDETTMEWTSVLDALIQRMLETYPDALQLGEKFDLTPHAMITHRRLKSANFKAYVRSPIIRNVERMLRRGIDFWRLVQRLRQVEVGELACDEAHAGLLSLKESLATALKSDGIKTAVDAKDFTCSERQRPLCETCPSTSELLTTISTLLSLYALALDNKSNAE